MNNYNATEIARAASELKTAYPDAKMSIHGSSRTEWFISIELKKTTSQGIAIDMRRYIHNADECQQFYEDTVALLAVDRDREVYQEVVRLSAVVDGFADAMKARLAEKAHEGYRGWDDFSQMGEIWQALRRDARDDRSDKTVDIANRAMMVWHFKQRQLKVIERLKAENAANMEQASNA